MPRRINIDVATAVKIMRHVKYLPSIILQIKNWPDFLLHYLGIKKGGMECLFRNGVKIKTHDAASIATISVVFIKKDYGQAHGGPIVIDIGANIGAYSIFVARASKNIRVFAFEPEKNNFKLLLENIKNNNLQDRIFPYNCAIAAREGIKDLYLGESPFHSFLPIKDSPFNALHNTDQKQSLVSVKCISLSDIFKKNGLKHCDMLKIDCEGAEYEILYNLPDEYFPMISEIRMEYHDQIAAKENSGKNLKEFLAKKSFVLGRERKGPFQGDLWLRKVRVCHVATIPLAVYFLLMGQLKNLRNSGYEVSIVCSPGKWDGEIEKEGFFLKKIKMTRRISPLSDLVSFLKLFFYFRKEKFDIVHTCTPKAGFLGTSAARVAGIPVIIHSNWGFYFNENTPEPKRTLSFIMEKAVGFFSDLIMSVDKEDIETAKILKIISEDKIKYLGGWVDVDRFDPSKFSRDSINRKKKEIGVPLHKSVIGITARLVKEKGYLDLFQALSIIKKDRPDVVLVVCGEEDFEKRDRLNPSIVKAYGLENDVIFLGQVINVQEIFAIMDVFVLPSWREGIGTSILEASAMGKPVVSTNVRGCREAVDDGRTGILVPVRSPEKLAKAIMFFLENPRIAEEFGVAGRSKIKNEFDENMVFNRINAEYNRLIREKVIK